jgi:hypothetical protein
VLDGESKPVSKASIRIREEGGSDLTSLLQFTAILEGRGLITGPDGTLRIPSLGSGRFVVQVNWRDLQIEEKVRIEAGKENRLDVKLKQGL